MVAILQTTFSNEFAWMKIFELQIKSYWNLFLRVQLTSHHWFRYWVEPVLAHISRAVTSVFQACSAATLRKPRATALPESSLLKWNSKVRWPASSHPTPAASHTQPHLAWRRYPVSLITRTGCCPSCCLPGCITLWQERHMMCCFRGCLYAPGQLYAYYVVLGEVLYTPGQQDALLWGDPAS